MKFKVRVTKPASETVQHIIQAEGPEEARNRALKAHPTAEFIEVQKAWGEE